MSKNLITDMPGTVTITGYLEKILPLDRQINTDYLISYNAISLNSQYPYILIEMSTAQAEKSTLFFPMMFLGTQNVVFPLDEDIVYLKVMFYGNMQIKDTSIGINDGTVDLLSQQLNIAVENLNQSINHMQQAIEDGMIVTYFQSTEPTDGKLGDLWFKETGLVYRHNGTNWQYVEDVQVQEALQAAADAMTTANGKITMYYQAEPPSAANNKDMWIDIDDNNYLYIRKDGQWVEGNNTSYGFASNILINSLPDADKGMTAWQFTGTRPGSIKAPSSGYPYFEKANQGSAIEEYLMSKVYQLDGDTYYTVSFEYNSQSVADLFVLQSNTAKDTNGFDSSYTSIAGHIEIAAVTGWTRRSLTFKTAINTKTAYLRFDANGQNYGTDALRVCRIKLERGKHATPWSRCPSEDAFYKVQAVEDYLEEKATEWDKITQVINESLQLVASKVVGDLSLQLVRLLNSTGTFVQDDNGSYWQDQPTKAASTFASRWNSEGIGFANGKDSNGEWIWKSIMGANGLVVPEITTEDLFGMTMQAVTLIAANITSGVITGVSMRGNTIISGNQASGNYIELTPDGELKAYRNNQRIFMLNVSEAGTIWIDNAGESTGLALRSKSSVYGNEGAVVSATNSDLILSAGSNFIKIPYSYSQPITIQGNLNVEGEVWATNI